MALINLIMPKMGESIIEATILKWTKQIGESVEMDETILEIATDKVDSEVPSPVKGKLVEIRFQEDEVVPVGTTIAVIATEGESVSDQQTSSEDNEVQVEKVPIPEPSTAPVIKPVAPKVSPSPMPTPASASTGSTAIKRVNSGRFYSPLVRNIASQEGIPQEELDAIDGTGKDGRLTKRDLLAYIENRANNGSAIQSASVSQTTITTPQNQESMAAQANPPKTNTKSAPQVIDGNVEIIEMDRMRKLIAKHMVNSKHTSPHVTSFVEADVTNIVDWRNSVKASFADKYGEKITYTPIFIDAVVKAIKDYPMINISVDEDRIIRKKDINIGMATALPSGNLIVPVIRNADHMNLVGLTKTVNDLAGRARNNKLKPEEIQGGTFTLTNVGTFGNVMGTPIINQPQVAIMAAGAIRKKPAVIETEYGDVIGIRQMMFLSLSYDHRVVDGFLGGSFLRRVADYLEQFDRDLQL